MITDEEYFYYYETIEKSFKEAASKDCLKEVYKKHEKELKLLSSQQKINPNKYVGIMLLKNLYNEKKETLPNSKI